MRKNVIDYAMRPGDMVVWTDRYDHALCRPIVHDEPDCSRLAVRASVNMNESLGPFLVVAVIDASGPVGNDVFLYVLPFHGWMSAEWFEKERHEAIV